MADQVTKSSDIRKPNQPKAASQPASTEQKTSAESAPKPGDPIDNPTASAADGSHPEPTKKNMGAANAVTGEHPKD